MIFNVRIVIVTFNVFDKVRCDSWPATPKHHMVIASFNLGFSPVAVGIGGVAAVLTLVIVVRLRSWLVAVFGTSVAWAVIAFLLVATASGDMAVGFMMVLFAGLAAACGAVAGPIVLGIVRLCQPPLPEGPDKTA